MNSSCTWCGSGYTSALAAAECEEADRVEDQRQRRWEREQARRLGDEDNIIRSNN